MATYVNDLRLKEIGTGESSGTWGTETNTNLELIAEAFSYGTEASFGSDADATTTIADGATDPARSLYLKITSGVSLTATRTLTIAPNTVSKVWIIENATSGSQSINISQGSGANVTIPNGDVKVVYSDGAGSGAAVVDAFTDLNLGGTTTVAGLSVSSTTTFSDDVTFTGASNNLVWDKSDDSLEFADNAKAKFGASDDLQIYHDGSNSRIQEAGTGSLLVRGTNLQLQDSDGYDYLTCTDGGNGGTVALKHLGSTVLSTASGGIDVTGTVNNMTIASNGSGFTCPTSQNFVINSPNGLRINIDSNNDGSSENFVVGHNQNDATNANNLLKITEAGTSTFFSTGTTDTVVLQSTDAGASAAPDLVLFRDSSSPADGDDIGNILFRGKDDGGNETSYAFIMGEINDASDGSEDGNLFFRTQSAGSLDNRISIVSDKIGIGTDSPQAEMHLAQDDGSGDVQFLVENTNTGAGDADCTIKIKSSSDASENRLIFESSLQTSAGTTWIQGDEKMLLQAEDYIAFRTNATNERARILANGNVGIGLTNPSQKMEISGNLRLGGMILKNTSDGGSIGFNRNPDDGAYIGSASLRRFQINGPNAVGGDFLEIQSYDSSGTSQGNIRIQDGNLGVGTTPSEHLHVNSGTSTTVAQFQSALGGAGNTAVVKITASGNSSSGLRFIQCGSTSSVEGGANAATVENTENAPLIFGTNGTERMRIVDDGTVCINATSSGSLDTKLYVEQDIATANKGPAIFTNPNTGTAHRVMTVNTGGNSKLIVFDKGFSSKGSISTNGTSTAYNTTSDYRLKENINYTWDATTRLKQLKPARFNFIEDETNTLVDGFIAHEVSSIVPEAVTGAKDAVDGNGNAVHQEMDAAKLIPLLVKTIQELETRITALES